MWTKGGWTKACTGGTFWLSQRTRPVGIAESQHAETCARCGCPTINRGPVFLSPVPRLARLTSRALGRCAVLVRCFCALFIAQDMLANDDDAAFVEWAENIAKNLLRLIDRGEKQAFFARKQDKTKMGPKGRVLPVTLAEVAMLHRRPQNVLRISMEDRKLNNIRGTLETAKSRFDKVCSHSASICSRSASVASIALLRCTRCGRLDGRWAMAPLPVYTCLESLRPCVSIEGCHPVRSRAVHHGGVHHGMACAGTAAVLYAVGCFCCPGVGNFIRPS